MNEILVKKTDIEGLLVVHTAIQQNPSGWFTENWHQEKMSRVGIRDSPVQHNITYVDKRGTTRGFHAEPWDRYISVLSGRAFMAWLDLREGPTHGRTHVRELGPGTSVLFLRVLVTPIKFLRRAQPLATTSLSTGPLKPARDLRLRISMTQGWELIGR